MTGNINILSAKKQNIILIIVCVIALVFFKVISGYLKTFDRPHINSDVIEYYAFVTAAFECNDLSFSNGCPTTTGVLTTPDGRKVNKRSIGMAYMYTPFYAVSQFGNNDDGYSYRTQKILVYGMWLYVCIGLFFLGRALFRFFSPAVVVSSLLLLIASTNLIWYTNGEPLFTHGVNFMWMSVLIYFTIVYHEKQKLYSILIIGFSVSMLALIRPVNLLLGIFPFLYGVYNKETFRLKIKLLQKNYRHLLLTMVIFILPVIPQILYWKFASGHWIFYSYQGERFFWTRPLVFDVLFSFRKGWFIYTPVMLLIIGGFWCVWHNVKPMFFPVIIIFPVFLYVISCWWAWSYGGCYGMRPMIDIYPLLVFSIAAFLDKKKWWVVTPMALFIVACTVLNIFQSWQYSRGILHYDQMNFATYKAIWRQERYPWNYPLLLSYPDYSKESSGKGSYYNLREITEIEVSIKFIDARYLCAFDSSQTGIKANHQYASTCDAFIIRYNAAKDKYTIQSSETHKYLTLDPVTNFVLVNETDILKASLFGIRSLGQNKFCFLWGERYMNSSRENQFRLKVGGTELLPSSYAVIRKYNR